MKPVKLSNLSDFQKQCFDILSNIASENNLIIKDFYTDGISEIYLVMEISNKNNICLKTWIYIDECMFSCNEISYYFEKYDFDNTDELVTSFIASILSVMNGIEPIQKRTSRINLFKGSKI
jgi:hypothetical protein